MGFILYDGIHTHKTAHEGLYLDAAASEASAASSSGGAALAEKTRGEERLLKMKVKY